MPRLSHIAVFFLTLTLTLSASAHPFIAADKGGKTHVGGYQNESGVLGLEAARKLLLLLEKPASNRTSASGKLFTGEQFDPNLGWYYLRARYYNPANGRFPTMDTYPGRMFEPPTLHKYLYTHADPVNGIDPSGNATVIETAAAQRMMTSLLLRAVATTNSIHRVQTAVGIVQSLVQAFRLLSDPTAIAALRDYFDPNNPLFEGILDEGGFEHATSVLRQNAARIAGSVARHKIASFMRYVPDKNSSVIFYLPTPIRSPGNGNLIPTPIKIPFGKFGSRPLKLLIGGKSTRFFGIGFTLGKRLNAQRQLFRMDWARSGSHYPGDAQNADYWTDPGFEFHVPKDPK